MKIILNEVSTANASTFSWKVPLLFSQFLMGQPKISRTTPTTPKNNKEPWMLIRVPIMNEGTFIRRKLYSFVAFLTRLTKRFCEKKRSSSLEARHTWIPENGYRNRHVPRPFFRKTIPSPGPIWWLYLKFGN